MKTAIKFFVVIWCVCGWLRVGQGANVYFPIPVDDGSAARAAAAQRARIGAAFEVKYDIEAYQAQMKRALAVEPWREIDGVTNSIFGEGWFHFCGKVTKVLTNGILVDGYILALTKFDVDHQIYFLVNFPYVVADNDLLEFTRYFMGKSSGTVTMPDGAVLHKYDYGKVCAPAPEYIAAMIAKNARARQVAENATLKLDQEKAEEGDAMYEYRLGMRYQNGNGVDKDQDKAREWFRKAAAQGYEDAKVALVNLNSSEAEQATNNPATER